MPKFRCLAEWFSVVLLILCMAVAVSAQSKGIDPALLAKAKAGDAKSQYDIDTAYEGGFGVPQDFAKVAFWDRKAAELGDAKAQADLGTMYELGSGVPQNIKEAMLQFQKAAEQGDVESEYMLGSIYEEGGLGRIVNEPDGSSRVLLPSENALVPKDYGLAAKWYRKAAEQGKALAQNGLGRLYADGKGVPQDYVEAYFWLSLATASGSHSSTNGVDDRDLVASHLTKTVLLETQGRARNWFEDHPAKPQ